MLIMSYHHRRYSIVIWTLSTAVFMVSCGTMPVPDMPQPSSIVAKTTVEEADKPANFSADATSNDENRLSGQQTADVTATQDAVANHQTSEVRDETSSAATDQPPAVEQYAEKVPINMGYAAVADVEDVEDVEVEATSLKSDEAILHEPVISKTQPSQTVFSAVTSDEHEPWRTATAQSSDKSKAELISTDGENNKIGVSATTASALVMLEGEPGIRSASQTESAKVPTFAVLTANDRVQNAIALLNEGDVQKAEKELADALVIEPNNRAARKLMQQLHETPADFFEEQEYFEYVLGPNETLFTVAEKFLEDPLEFYMLAKLNNIKYPNSMVPGKMLIVPGANRSATKEDSVSIPQPSPMQVQTRSAEPVNSEEDIQIERAKVYFAEHRYREAIELLKLHANKEPASKYIPVRELLAQCYIDLTDSLIIKGNLLEAQTTLESSVETLPGNMPLKTKLAMVRNNREAERLYRLGLQESENGKGDQAIKSFAKALQLNPSHEQAKKQIRDLRLTVVEEYHKRAMVLYRKQELNGAIEIWDDVLQLDPNHELAKQYRNRALELKRKIEQL